LFCRSAYTFHLLGFKKINSIKNLFEYKKKGDVIGKGTPPPQKERLLKKTAGA